MKIVFFGTPDFAAKSLETLLLMSNHQIVATVTAPDHIGGRGGKQLIQSHVKKLALDYNIPILQPEKLRNKEFLQTLEDLQADLFIIVAFRMLPEVVWSMPPKGSFNLHGSLLPKYRGAAPINWAIINGEKTTGITIFKLQNAIDTGDVLLQKTLAIHDTDNFGTMYDKMKDLGAHALIEALQMIQEEVDYYPQDDAVASHAPKIFHKDCKINFSQNSREVFNFIRGMSPYPGAWTIINQKECKILESVIYNEGQLGSPGKINTDQKKWLRIQTRDGEIEIVSLKMSGSKQMLTKDFLSGNQINELSVRD
ncbi:MAG: methionyl-tRNA formyltransferase [Saprospiraceae bacterium]